MSSPSSAYRLSLGQVQTYQVAAYSASIMALKVALGRMAWLAFSRVGHVIAADIDRRALGGQQFCGNRGFLRFELFCHPGKARLYGRIFCLGGQGLSPV